MGLSVNRATDFDVAAWIELAAEVGDLFGSDMASDPKFRDSVARNVARGSAFCVRIDGALAGAMLYKAGSIGWLAVASRFRRRGVARALVAHAQADGRDLSVTTFGQGHPHPDSQLARGFYRAMGFQVVTECAAVGPDGTPRAQLSWRPIAPAASIVSRSMVRGILVTDSGEVLLMKMSFPWFAGPVWIAPGGGLEDGESTLDGLRRELHEETGRNDLPIGPLVWERRFVVKHQGRIVHAHERYFVVRTERFVPDLRQLEEQERAWLEACRWWRVDELAQSSEQTSPDMLASLLQSCWDTVVSIRR
jgi:ADP-ribose pyrophosphatase YjhB (NUDIX family)/ribosomal protein S18 acetylase RimI-like enzyme